MARGDLDSRPELDPNYMFGWRVLGVVTAALVVGGAIAAFLLLR